MGETARAPFSCNLKHRKRIRNCEESMNRSLWRIVVSCMVLLVAVAVCCIHAFAQQTLGSINGTVVDPSGASVSGASVTVTNSAINVSRTTTTQGTGFYQLFNLPIGTYVVKVTHEGFETTELKAIAVQEAQAKTVNVTLKVGQTSESIEVTANPLLNAS